MCLSTNEIPSCRPMIQVFFPDFLHQIQSKRNDTPESNIQNACLSRNQYVQENTLVVDIVNAACQVNINIYSQVFGNHPNKRKWRRGRKRKNIAIAQRTFLLRATWHHYMLSFSFLVVLTMAQLLVCRSRQQKLPEESLLFIFYAPRQIKNPIECVFLKALTLTASGLCVINGGTMIKPRMRSSFI